MDNMDRVLNGIDKINDKITGISKELGRNSAQHDSFYQTLGEIREQTIKTNGRVGSLEKFRIKIIAYATVISMVAGGVFKLML